MITPRKTGLLSPYSVYALRVSRQAVQILEVAVIAVVMGSFVLVIARRHFISFRYTIGWLGLCAVTFLGALLVPVVEPVHRFSMRPPTWRRAPPLENEYFGGPARKPYSFKEHVKYMIG